MDGSSQNYKDEEYKNAILPYVFAIEDSVTKSNGREFYSVQNVFFNNDNKVVKVKKYYMKEKSIYSSISVEYKELILSSDSTRIFYLIELLLCHFGGMTHGLIRYHEFRTEAHVSNILENNYNVISKDKLDRILKYRKLQGETLLDTGFIWDSSFS